MAKTNGRGSTHARERHAKRTAAKVDHRREQATGAAGWVADRAGDWSLDAQDLGWMDRQKYFWNPLMDFWFRMEIEGWEKLPEPPALLIGDPLGRAVRVGRVDGRHPVVAPFRRRPPGCTARRTTR